MTKEKWYRLVYDVLRPIGALLCAAALCALDIYVGRPLADKLSQRMKAVNIILLAALAAVAEKAEAEKAEPVKE